MMRVLLGLSLLLALTTYSSATYCLCRDGVGVKQLQAALDYACGTKADCKPILPNGACFQPNTVKAHCDYAVNSYFQRERQAPGSCFFAGSATTSTKPPSDLVTGCVYPSSPSAGTPTPPTPTGSIPTTGSPGTPASPRTPVFPGPPVFNGATGFYISSALTTLLCISALVFLWGQ